MSPPDLRRPALLDRARHSRDAFDSGDPVLDEWLRRYAGQNQRRGFARTWVVTDLDDDVVAFVSVSVTGIPLGEVAHHPRGAPDPLPAVLIGRLAVDRHHVGRGIATALVEHALLVAARVAQEVGVGAVVVRAASEELVGFYERMGFRPLDEERPELLWMPMGDVVETVRALVGET